jgi:hydrogenase maturation protein HypF
MGGEIKNTFCLASGRHAWVSQHMGDMGSLETLAAFERSTRQFGDMYEVDPQQVAADAHPGYHTRAWADEHAPGRGGPRPPSPRAHRGRHGGARGASGRAGHRLRLRRHRLRHRRRHLGR